MTIAKTRTKPKCTATPCGYTCISNKYTCSSKILKRDADELLKAASKPLKIDGQKPPTDLSTPEAIEKYVRAWQSSRGFDQKESLDIHDIDHAIAYKSSGLSPAEITDKYGFPGRAYDGKPTWAEEAFVFLHSVSAMPNVTREQSIDYITSYFSKGTLKGYVDPRSFPGGDKERDFYADVPKMMANFADMYDTYVKTASPEDRSMSARNSVRYMEASVNGISGELEIAKHNLAIQRDIRGDKGVFEFSEIDSELVLNTFGLAKLLLSMDNCGRTGYHRKDFDNYLAEATLVMV